MMTEKFRGYVSSLLAAAPDCAEKDDIIEEMVGNLCEKYEELLAEGKTQHDAYQEAVDGVGDPGEIISYIRSVYDLEQARDTQQRPGDAFSGIDETLRSLGNEIDQAIQSSMRALGRGIEEVTRSLKDAKISVDINTARARDEDDNCHIFPAEGVESLFAQMKAGDLTFGLSPDDCIHVTERGGASLRDDQKLVCEMIGKTLKITQGKSAVGTFRWGFGVFCCDVEVLLPARTWNEIRIVTASGDVRFEQELRARIASFKTASGDVQAEAVCCEQLVLETASGDTRLGGAATIMTTNGVSGDLMLQDMTVRELKCETVSGEISLRGVFAQIDAHSVSGDIRTQCAVPPEALAAQTVSGDITLALPENDGFTVQFSRVSGDFSSDFVLAPPTGGKSGRSQYRDGAHAEYAVKTISGDIRLRRRR